MAVKLIIFDFWKTLAYPVKTDPEKFYSSLGAFGIKLNTLEERKYFSSMFSKLMCISRDWNDFAKHIFRNFAKDLKEKNLSNLVDFLKKECRFNLYDDVKEVSKLSFKKVILTDSSKFLVESVGLKGFSAIFTPHETKALKPDPKVFMTVINSFGLKPEEAVMIGDDIERDLITPQKLGMKTILIDREDKFKEYQGVRINSLREVKVLLKL